MTTLRTYSIVGSGNVGSALARIFARAHIDVTIANTRGPESLRDLTTELGPTVQAASIADAIEHDVIFIPIPFHSVDAFGRTLSDWTGKIIVDTTNSFWTPNADEILQGRLSSEFVAEAFPGAELVKAFNQLPSNVLSAAVPSADGKRVVFISSNSDTASGVIAQLARDLGFAPIELGRIDEGGRLIQAQNALVLRPLIEQPRS